MRWTARTALAGTAGVALVGAGVLTAAYAATGSPQPAPSTVAQPSADPQVVALTQEAHDLQDQLAGLQAAVGQLPAPAPAVATTAPAPTEEAPAPASAVVSTPERASTVTHEPAESGDHEAPEHEGSGSDD